jgi:hypothetical protein
MVKKIYGVHWHFHPSFSVGMIWPWIFLDKDGNNANGCCSCHLLKKHIWSLLSFELSSWFVLNKNKNEHLFLRFSAWFYLKRLWLSSRDDVDFENGTKTNNDWWIIVFPQMETVKKIWAEMCLVSQKPISSPRGTSIGQTTILNLNNFCKLWRNLHFFEETY